MSGVDGSLNHTLLPEIDVDLRDKFVYFVEEPAIGYIKVGSAANPIVRFSALQVGCPVPLRMIGITLGSSRHEKDIKLYLRDKCIRGEWYEPTDELREFLDHLPSLTDFLETRTAPRMGEPPDLMVRLHALGYSYTQIGDFFGCTRQNVQQQTSLRSGDRRPMGNQPLTDPPIELSYADILRQFPPLALAAEV